MHLEGEGVLARIYLGESDRAEGLPAYEAIVRKARERKLAGATVLRGAMGFGASSRLHTARILRLSEDLPILVELVDEAEKIEAFLRDIEPMMGGGLVTIEKVRVLRYRPGGAAAGAQS